MRTPRLMKKMICFLLLAALLLVPYGIQANAKKTVDTQPPTAPQNLIASSVSQTSISMKWSASTDNKGVAAYLIYKNNTYLTSVTGTSYAATALTAGTAYSFYVKAKDYTGNLSASSNILAVATLSSVPVPVPSAKVVSGYYASWAAYSGYTPLNIPASQLTVVNYAFANIGTDLKIALGDPSIDPTNFTQLNELKKTYPTLKTLISIGGWEGSGRFSDAALTDASRTAFADSVVAFIKQYGFNGVDIDWEYPVSGGLSTNIKRPEDKTNFTLLLQKLREKLNAQQALDGKQYLLTIAGGAGSAYTANTELSKIGSIIDYANLMTYDIHGSWDTYTDLSAPLYTPTESTPQYKWSADASVKAWTAAGFPAAKIVLGVPFYGYIYSGVTNSNHGLYQTFTSAASIPYDKILSTYLPNTGFVKSIHPDALVPWLFNGSVFISYDDEGSLAAKANYIKQDNLAGAAVWELSQNRNGILLNALYTNLK